MALMRLFLGAVVAICATITATQATTVVSWIQLGPGSSPAALASGSYGDQPASLTPTILARALITSRSGGCPSVTLENGTALTMNPRFDATQSVGGVGLSGGLHAVGTSPNTTTAFVTATTQGTLSNGDQQATTDWTVCEAVVPPGHTTATIDGTQLKLPIAHPQRILVIADTGCRLTSSATTTASGGFNQQDCHNPNFFPFNYLSTYEAQFAPDLVIQVGDYFYRDAPCAPGVNNYNVAQNTATEASGAVACNDPTNASYDPWGDTFDAWNGDLFFPAAQLLQTAPWIMVRGNHESCGRGARGWFALLDPHPYNLNQVNCPKNAGNATVTGTTPLYTGDFTPSYAVPAGQISFIVHDSSFANDSSVDTNMAKNYDLDLTALLSGLHAAGSNGPFVYATHKPTYGLTSVNSGGYDASGNPNSGDFTEQFTFSGNATANSAFHNGVVPPSIAFFLSGHIHEFEYVNFTNNANFAPQLIVGTGGDNLDYTANPTVSSLPSAPPPTAQLTYQYATGTPKPIDLHASATTATVSQTTVTNEYSQAEFGFAVLDATATGYVANVYTLGNNRAGRCVITLSPRSIQCWK